MYKDPVAAKTTDHDAVALMLDIASAEQLIIMPTTNSAYGSGDENNFCTEESPLNPISSYAIEKVEVEKKLMEEKIQSLFVLQQSLACLPECELICLSTTSLTEL